MPRILHRTGLYGLVFICLILFFVFFLLAGCFLPQGRINKHILASADLFENEGDYHRTADQQESATLDNYTEALILMEAQAMNRIDYGRIFSNPLYFAASPVAEFRSITMSTEEEL